MRKLLHRSLLLLLALLTTDTIYAQFELFPGRNKSSKATDPAVKITTSPKSPRTGDEVTLTIRVQLPEESHTYSTADGFSGKTKIELTKVVGAEPLGKGFTADQKPKLKKQDGADGPVETMTGVINWTRKFKVIDSASFALAGTLRFQICDASSCRPVTEKFSIGNEEAETTPPPAPPKTAPKFEADYTPTEFSPEGQVPGPVSWNVKLHPQNAKPGETVTLEFAAKIRDKFHIFSLDQNKNNLGLPTVISPYTLNGLEPVSDKDSFTASREPEAHQAQGKSQRIYHESVSFRRSYRVTEGTPAGKYGIAGTVSYQVCDTSCRRGKYDFAVGDVVPKKPVVQSANGAQAANDAEKPNENAASGEQALAQLLDGLKYENHGLTRSDASLLMYLFYAFIGGIILNVMPCVLPVIAIKALGFAQQAGESKGRVLALNASYSAGVLVVFALLASLAAFAGFAWGGLFQMAEFNIAMCLLVFAMSLSLLGVFEIPVPGFVGSAAGSQHKEGLSGAFFTGIFATVMATPCSGPFLGTTLGWSVKQSIPVIYLVWIMIGVGMCFPYMIFGLFPQAIKLLPKPGNWMVRFKEIAGFCLLGTTVYLLTILEERYLMPMIISLFAIGLGLWMIGNLYDYSSTNGRRWIVRVSSFGLMFAISWFGFKGFEEKYHWQKFQPEAVSAALKENKPVMIDFTADWCATCKFVERTTLNTDATKELVEKYGIVPFKADWTNGDPVIDEVLKKFDSNSIPVLAVFSPARPKEPIILREAWSKATLLEVLERAANPQSTSPKSSAPIEGQAKL